MYQTTKIGLLRQKFILKLCNKLLSRRRESETITAYEVEKQTMK